MITVAIVITVLVLIVISSNVRYAIKEYLGSSRRVMFGVYLGVLVSFGVVTIRSTLRLLNLFQDAREANIDVVGVGLPY